MNHFEDIQIDKIIVRDRIREDLGDVDFYARSIEKYGLLHPIVVCIFSDSEYLLINGFLRLNACKLLGWKKITANILDDRSLLEESNNER